MGFSGKWAWSTLRGHADLLIACAVFGVAISIVHWLSCSPFVAYSGDTWPPPSRTLEYWFGGAVVVSTLVSLLFFRLPPRPLLHAQRAVILAFPIYAVTCGLPAYGGGDRVFVERLEVLAIARWVALLCGFVALLQPMLGLPLILYVLWFRLEAAAVSGLGSDNADLSAIGYFGLTLLVCFMGYAVAARIVGYSVEREDGPFQSRRGPSAILLVLLFCPALYVSNYFSSGLGKESLYGPWNAWLLQNHTDALIPISHAIGTLPIAGWG
jgi:hypothetical protein